jgi:hypothetical protein
MPLMHAVVYLSGRVLKNALKNRFMSPPLVISNILDDCLGDKSFLCESSHKVWYGSRELLHLISLNLFYNMTMECSKHPDATFSPKGKCRECNREYQAKWYRANTDVHKARVRGQNKKRDAIRRQYVWDYLLAHPCVECAETDPVVLTFDHIDRSTKKYAVSQMTGYTMPAVKKEIEKCRVLCANCHMRHTAKQLGYWVGEYPDRESNPLT